MGSELNSWIGMAFLNLGEPPQEPTSMEHCHYNKELDLSILNSSHCTRSVYRIIHAQV